MFTEVKEFIDFELKKVRFQFCYYLGKEHVFFCHIKFYFELNLIQMSFGFNFIVFKHSIIFVRVDFLLVLMKTFQLEFFYSINTYTDV